MARAGKISFDLEANSSSFTQGLSSAERAMASMQKKAAEFVGRVDGAFDSISKKASTSGKAMEAALKAQRDSMQRMIDAADPVSASLRQIAAAEAEVNKALAYGTITAQEHALIMGNLGKAAATGGRGFSNYGMLIQQAGYQISDIASVAAAGGNAMATAGTQLGQFLGFMGPIGAVTGAAVTILGLFATKMLQSGDASEEAKRQLDLYEKSLSEILEIEKDYNNALRERLGLSKRDTSMDSLKQRNYEARAGLSLSANEKPSFFSGMWSSFKQKLGFSRDRTDAEKALAEESQAASDLAYARSVKEAEQTEKTKTVIQDINEERKREADLMKVSASERDRARVMMEAELDVRKRFKEASSTPEEIQAEVDKARSLAASYYDQQKAEEELAKSKEKLKKQREEELKEEIKLEEARSKISGSIQQEIDDNDKLIEALKVSEAEYERVKALLEVVNQYRRAGLEMSPEEVKATEEAADKLAEQRSQMDGLKEKYQSLKKLGADLGMTFTSAFEDAIVEGKKFSDVLQSLYQDILRLIIRQQITQPLASSFNSSFSGILGKLFPSEGSFSSTNSGFDLQGLSSSDWAGAFAGGTNRAPPGMAWVGEQGPELIKLRGGEQIFPASLSRKIASSYNLPGYAEGIYDKGAVSGGVEVNIINKSGADIKTNRHMVGGVDTIDVLVDRAVAKNLSQRGSGSNKAIRQTFGATEQLISR